MTPKIATCCYCGTRAALVLSGRERHELACSSCGAPLHEMKMLKAAPSAHSQSKPSRTRPGEPRNRPVKRKPIKRKSRARWMLEEVWDFVEDIFD
ncbi:hypothetical protein [Ovoidimarina sediminis]|uniref:hypothetical protein n=1 Tax=Ovoidimarina sediminis TaxID=3079856 RepID=UPI00290CA592|nr:hypothetical protein [Rhodophyticola sp. MJ-SS7]MDU8946756.1 hypothetical protein [Rhodophyticola sp. MJ-SS7]